MHSEFIENQYKVIRGFITPLEARKLNTDFISFVNHNNFQGDSQAPRSQSVYNFIPFVRLLVNKVPLISEAIGEEVLPTYTYARVYLNGQDLTRHTDRYSCEISITLNLFKDHAWPIGFLNSRGEEVTVELEPGDGVIYMGCVAEHWREPFQGNMFSQVFLHYVRSYGEFCTYAFDRGKNHEPSIRTTG